MSNILKAIEKEKEYLFHRMQGEELFHFVDAVKECGFNSLEEYFFAKKDYHFGNLNFAVETVQPSEAVAKIFRMMTERETKVLFVPSTETFVYSGDGKMFNEEYCRENNIPIYPLDAKAGTIVSTDGDFGLIICYPENMRVDVHFILNKIKSIFGRYMTNVEVNGNDILLNGKKICGAVMYYKNGMNCFGAHFSFNDNSELIEKICGAAGSVKVPTAIKGMTTEDFKAAICTWLRIN
jgi:hypothetical protein